MKKILAHAIVLLTLLPGAHGAGYDSDSQRRAKPFVDGMLNMMDRMGFIDLDDYPSDNGSDFDWHSTPSRPSFDGYPASPFALGITPRMPALVAPYRSRSPASPLDGIWWGRSGEVLMVRDGHFRIYVTRDRYRQGKLRIRGKYLYMHDPHTQATKKYEFATQKGRLVLRDADGQLLLYRRLQKRQDRRAPILR